MCREAKRRILVVDDTSTWQHLISTILEDYQVVVAGSYAQAAHIVDTQDFDLAVLDIRLEDEDVWNVDGVKLLQKIRADKPGVGIVVLTGYPDSVRDKALQNNAPDILITKDSIDIPGFRQIIDTIIRQHSVG